MKKTFLCLFIWLCLCSFQASYAQQKSPQLVTLSFGYGNSYGGLGFFGQINTGTPISLHGGAGYFPASVFLSEDFVKDVVLASAGLKVYLPLDMDPIYPYFDFQFGGLGVKAEERLEYYYDPWYGIWYWEYTQDQKTLWGPSILAGAEVKLMETFGLNGSLGLSYSITEVEWTDARIFIALDLGFTIYF